MNTMNMSRRMVGMTGNRYEKMSDSFVLHDDLLWRGTSGPGESYIRVLEGTVWITESADSADYIVEHGRELVLHGKGEIVIQSLRRNALVSVREMRRASHHPGV